MEMELDQSQAEGSTTEESAANPVGSLDLDKFKGEILGAVTSSFDDRFKGFQKMIAKRDKQFEDFVKEFQSTTRADWSEEERQAYDEREKDEQIARLQMALELRDLEKEFPEVAPVFSKVLDADSPRAQMEILKEALTPKQPEQEQPVESAQTEQNASEVDPNSPADTGTSGMNLDDMFEKDPSLLDRILRVPRMRGPS